MKFSTDTLSVLKNFSTINPSIVFKPGSVVRTISPQKTVMAAATIDETVETQAGVYDLSRFLSTLALFDNPDASDPKRNATFLVKSIFFKSPN